MVVGFFLHCSTCFVVLSSSLLKFSHPHFWLLLSSKNIGSQSGTHHHKPNNIFFYGGRDVVATQHKSIVYNSIIHNDRDARGLPIGFGYFVIMIDYSLFYASR